MRFSSLGFIFVGLAACSSTLPSQHIEDDAAPQSDAKVSDAKLVDPKPDAATPPDAPPSNPADAGVDAQGEVTTTIETIAPAQEASGVRVTLKCELRDGDGNVIPWPASLTATVTIGDPTVIEDKGGGVFYARKAGTTTVTCKAGNYTDATPATVKVVPGTPATGNVCVISSLPAG